MLCPVCVHLLPFSILIVWKFGSYRETYLIPHARWYLQYLQTWWYSTYSSDKCQKRRVWRMEESILLTVTLLWEQEWTGLCERFPGWAWQVYCFLVGNDFSTKKLTVLKSLFTKEAKATHPYHKSIEYIYSVSFTSIYYMQGFLLAA